MKARVASFSHPLLIVHDMAVVLDNAGAGYALCGVGQNFLQLHAADHTGDWQALVYRGMEGVELDIPAHTRNTMTPEAKAYTRHTSSHMQLILQQR